MIKKNRNGKNETKKIKERKSKHISGEITHGMYLESYYLVWEMFLISLLF